MRSNALNSHKANNQTLSNKKYLRSATEFNPPYSTHDQSSITSTAKNSYKVSPNKSPSPDISSPEKTPTPRTLTLEQSDLPTSKSLISKNIGKKDMQKPIISNGSQSISTFPPSEIPNKAIIKRKDSRSLTSLNNPSNTSNLNKPTTEKNKDSKADFIRQNSRNKTEMILADKSIKNYNTNHQIAFDEINKKKVENSKNSILKGGLSSNYKIEQTPARVFQKEKKVMDNPFMFNEVSVQDVKFENCDESYRKNNPLSRIYERKSIDENKNHLQHIYKQRRSSIGSNGSMNSMMFSEGNHEILYELTKSVQELNQRLIRNEEINVHRLHENIILKNTIKSLENKLDDHKAAKIEKEGISVGCTNDCLLF